MIIELCNSVFRGLFRIVSAIKPNLLASSRRAPARLGRGARFRRLAGVCFVRMRSPTSPAVAVRCSTPRHLTSQTLCRATVAILRSGLAPCHWQRRWDALGAYLCAAETGQSSELAHRNRFQVSRLNNKLFCGRKGVFATFCSAACRLMFCRFSTCGFRPC